MFLLCEGVMTKRFCSSKPCSTVPLSVSVSNWSNESFTFIHSAMSSKSSKLRKEFFSLAIGPSASRRRHTWNLSQYPWFPEHGAPPTSGSSFLWKWRESTEEVVLAQVSGLSAMDTKEQKIQLKYTTHKYIIYHHYIYHSIHLVLDAEHLRHQSR